MISGDRQPKIGEPQLILPDLEDGGRVVEDVLRLSSVSLPQQIEYDRDIRLCLEARHLEATNLVYALAKVVKLQSFTHGTLMLDATNGALLIEVINGRPVVSRSLLNPTRK